MIFGPIRKIASSAVLLSVTLFVGGNTLAQTSTGGLRGQVTDPSGSSVAKAAVLLTTPAGDSLDATSGKDGGYEFKGLTPGVYTVKVVAPGFTLFTAANVEIAAGKTFTLNISLAIEIQKEKVVVSDTSTQVDVNPANNAGAIVLQGKDLEALSDDPDELQSELQALAGPSAGPNGGQIYIDGFTGGTLPPKASIREIRINQNPFSAEYDRLGYGRIEIFTKPGTDQFHGQLYVSGNDSAFNARNPFERLPAGTAPPGYESTQYSANVGGPLGKKASFFFNIEHRDIHNLSIVSTPVVELTAPFNIVPFSAAVPNPDSRTNLSPRLDFQISKNNALTVRYQYEHAKGTNNGIGQFMLPSQGINELNNEHQIQFSDTWTVSPKMINETRFRYGHEVNAQTPQSTGPSLYVQGAFSSGGNGGGTNTDTQDRYELQNNSYMNFAKHSPKFGGRLRVTRDVNSSNSNFNGNFSFGSRQFLDPSCTVTPTNNCMITFSGIQAYQKTLQLLATNTPFSQIIAQGGGATSYSVTTGAPAADVNYFDVGLFVQDDWRLRPNVTFSYGLRYESQNQINDHADIAPRVGLAWGIGGDGKKPPKMVLRLGYGIFYDRFGYSLVLEQERLNGSLQQQFRVDNPTFYLGSIPSITQLQSFVTSSTIYQPNPNLRTPYTLQTGISLERQLSKSANIALTYLNARGVHQFYTDNINALECQSVPCDATTASRPITGNPNNVFQYQSSGLFKQNQFIVNTTVRVGAKVSLFGYYTLNYANGDTSGTGSFPSIPGHVALDYGRTGFDVRHRVFMGGSVNLPYAIRLNPFLIASSGNPFNITTGHDLYLDGNYNARPVLGNCTTPGGAAVQTAYGCFDPTPQIGATPIPINVAQGDARFSLNLRLSKTFGFGKKKEAPDTSGTGGPMGGGTFGRGPGGDRRGGGFGGGRGGSSSGNSRYGLTFGVAARNIFNKVNLATPTGDLSSPIFGQANALAGRPFSDSTSNRRLDLQLTFSF